MKRSLAAAVGRRWVLRWEEAMKGTPAEKVRTASPKLVVGGIGCCCVAWWRLALMETEGGEDAAEGEASVLTMGFFRVMKRGDQGRWRGDVGCCCSGLSLPKERRGCSLRNGARRSGAAAPRRRRKKFRCV